MTDRLQDRCGGARVLAQRLSGFHQRVFECQIIGQLLGHQFQEGGGFVVIHPSTLPAPAQPGH